MIFLAIDLVTESDALSGEEIARDARALIRRDLSALPRGCGAVPFIVKEAGLTIGSGHEPEGAPGDSEHGVEGVIKRVRDEGGLVDDEESDVGEATDIGCDTRESDDAAAVGQENRVRIAAIAPRLDIELT